MNSVDNNQAWLQKFRQRHGDAFLEKGLPTRKDERWKYTDLSFLDKSPLAPLFQRGGRANAPSFANEAAPAIPSSALSFANEAAPAIPSSALSFANEAAPAIPSSALSFANEAAPAIPSSAPSFANEGSFIVPPFEKGGPGGICQSTTSPQNPEISPDAINQHRLRYGESILLVFINGSFIPTHSDLAKFPEGVIACNLAEALQTHPDLVKNFWNNSIDTERYPFANLNATLFADGLFFYLPENQELTQPVHLLSIVTGENEFIAHPHHLFVLGENSKLILVEEYFALVNHSYMMNIVTSMSIGRNAKLEYYKIQQEGKQGVHMAHTFIQQMQNSNITFTDFSFGATFARNDFSVTLQEPGANCSTAGFYHLRSDNQYIDHHIDINHSAPRSSSEMLYKGILDNKSRAVFNGRLHVEKDAQKIIAYQANHNLLLAADAEVYSKPELEIYADDVKCKHGATTGQLDQDAIFYMRSRGIENAEAINILLQGFAEEVIQRVTHPGIKMRIQELL